ncbi:uncharacterized protein LAESUDRAFT_729107 [Laetiporus sulphureus 93-53]|uniref:DRBM domain-containing protein n=1 Tax=Laetiporus sulphureus 93-53 TaxID=1314785 RepID=A0A165CVQ6_9APHY|nr:uncharacterized protein LAESUDRAFT_729107 [Laetiporus sulphureus 93-53]KZT03519.1 hypothetical protein LAESUDRAFT_729107 [Laetiporus sulphureus 93-53]
MVDWRMKLNNYLQMTKSTNVLNWEINREGSRRSMTWTAVLYIGREEYGRGMAAGKGGAMELAAEQALRTLRS